MRKRALKSSAAAIFAAIMVLVPLAGYLQKVYAAREQQDERKSRRSADHHRQRPRDLAVTVYNSNIALVRDVRQIHLSAGVFPLKFEDVAASINPATVHFRSLTEPAKLNVVEQNYEYDLLDPQKLLQKYVGREVTLVRAEKDAGSTKWVETKALLLSDNNGPVWKIGNEIVTGMGADSYRFPELPGNLYSRPTLVWTLDNRGAERPEGRSILSHEQYELERRLRPHRHSRRESSGPRRLGHARRITAASPTPTRSCSWSPAKFTKSRQPWKWKR